MRILMVIGQYAPMVGGAERQCQLLAAACAERGHRVRVLTVRSERAHPRWEVIDGVTVERVRYPIAQFGSRRVGFGFLAPLLVGWRVWRMLPGVDCIIAHQALWPAFVATVAASVRRTPIIVKIGNSGERFDLDVLQRAHGYGGFARRFLIRSVTQFIGTSTAVRADLSRAGVPEDRIVAIPNGVRIPAHVPARTPTPLLQLLFVGTLTSKKRVECMIDALAALPAMVRDAYALTIVGDGPLRADIEARVRRSGLNRTVQFLGARNDIPDILARHDVLVLPSATEGLSNAALEAMASGLPLVLSNRGGNPDCIVDPQPRQGFQHGANGYLFDPDDPAALTRIIAELAADREEVRAMGERSRALAADRFALPAVVDAYLAAAAECVRRSRLPRILHLLTFLDSQTGGMERQALQLARMLRERGYTSTFITSIHRDVRRRDALPWAGAIDGFPVHRIPFTRGWRRVNAVVYTVAGLALLVVLWRRYDIIHAHQLQTSGVVASIVRRLLPRKRTLVKDATGGPHGDIAELVRLGPWPTRALRGGIDAFVAVSAEAATELTANGFAPVRSIPNGVDVDAFRPPDPATRAAARRQLLGDHASTARCILGVGRLHTQKNFRTLIDAVALLDPAYLLVLVGDGPECQTLAAHASAVGVADRVRFVGAVADVRPYYHTADCVALPSRSEGMPNVLLEAMACGVPVIGSDIPSIRAVVPRDGETPLVHPDDAARLAAAIRATCADRSVGSRRGARGRAHVDAEYRAASVAAQYATVYSELWNGSYPHPS